MIYAFCGNLGAGKTYNACRIAFKLMAEWDKILVTNLAINTDEVYRWMVSNGHFKAAARVRAGCIYYENDVVRMMRYRNAIVLLDEATVFLSSKLMQGRDYKLFAPMIADLLQSRKADQSHLFWIAQHYDRVAAEIRDVTNKYYHAFNFGRYNLAFRFKGYYYSQWLREPTFKRWYKGFDATVFHRWDTQIFKCYDTMQRLDGRDPERASDVHQVHGEWVEGPDGPGLVLPSRNGVALQMDLSPLAKR